MDTIRPTDLYHCPRMNARMTESACAANRKWVTWKPSIKPGTSKRSRKLIKGGSAQMGTLERLDVQADRAIYCRGCPGVRAIAEQQLDVLEGWAVDKPTEWPEDPRRFCPQGKHLRIAWWSIAEGACRACKAERAARLSESRSKRARRDNPKRRGKPVPVKVGLAALEPIARSVAERHGLRVDHLQGRTRAQSVYAVRCEAMKACRDAGATIYQIGLLFRRNHSTVLSALARGGPVSPTQFGSLSVGQQGG